MFLRTAKKVFKIFPLKAKFYFLFILSIFLLSMFLETMTIALFLPLVSFILNRSIEENSLFKIVKDNFNIDLSNTIPDYNSFILYFIIIFAVKTILVLICKFQILNFSKNCSMFLISNLFKRYINLPFNKIIALNSAEFVKNLTHEIDQFSSALQHTVELIGETIVIIGILAFLFFFNYKISLIGGVSFLIIIIIFSFFTKKKLFDLSEKIRHFENSRIKNYLESFSLIKEIKLFNREDYFIKKNIESTFGFWQNDLISKFIRSFPKPTIELFFVVILILLISFLNNARGSDYTLEFLAIFVAATYRILPSLFKIINSGQNIRAALPATLNLLKDLNQVPSSYQKKIKLNNLEEKILVKKLSFKHENNDNYIIKDLSFCITKGQIFGIKGKTGSGKTTLINLLCGLLNPTEGDIYYDKISSQEIDIKSLHKKIGYVSQSIYLMDDTIDENLSFGEPVSDQNEFKNLISICELENFIKNQPKGLKTTIGEKSSKISGGQSQRIGIARALIKKPQILILDEATSALDLETTQKIMKNILKHKKSTTIILISHDPKVLALCEEVVDLDNQE